MAKLSYKHTLSACFIGYITQAIVNNFAPLLFLTFQTEFSIGLDKITMLVTINFVTQLIVDMLSAKVVDKIGYKPCIIAAHVFCATGLIGLALFPGVGDPYAGLLIAVVLYAIGGGLIEVLVSPIAEACPTTDKTGAMSLLHSFYCWGSAAVILVTTLLLLAIGSEHWRWLAVGWAAVPIFNAIYYGFVPVGKLQEEEGGTRLRTLFSSGTFWLFAVMMLCAGASELSMSQWASAFAESGLGISKTSRGCCMRASERSSTHLSRSHAAVRFAWCPICLPRFRPFRHWDLSAARCAGFRSASFGRRRSALR